MLYPNLSLLEKLVPNLLQIRSSKTHSSDKEIKNCLNFLNTAFLRWLIIFSLYETEGNLFLPDIPVFEHDKKNKCLLETESNEFKCSDWQKKINQILLEQNFPSNQELTIQTLLDKLFTDNYKQSFLNSLKNRYFFNDEIISTFLKLKPLDVHDKTIRNNFNDLFDRHDKLLKKTKRGYYSKSKREDVLIILQNSDSPVIENNEYSDVLDYLTNDLSTITELLMTKINGKQRLFIHHEYVATVELREESANLADRLKEIWKENTIPPLQINYYSASLNQEGQYIVYPVCLYYYQRAYYLCAYGQAPVTESSEQLQWYNYRLDRISKIKKLSWDNADLLLDKSKFIDLQVYSPEYIQEQLEAVYGFDFYQPDQFMILRFNPDFAQRYIDNSFRHSSFEKIDDFQEVISIIKQESEEKFREKLISIARLSPNHSYYLLRYRQNDNNVIMRLRAWGHNVEVICPWDLRQRMKNDLQKTWEFYQNN